jgi:hypothetical protein
MDSHGLTRRYWLSACTALAAGAFGPHARAQSPGTNDAAPAPRHRISATQVRDAVAQRFPLRYPVGGLFELAVQAPELRFMAASDRVGAQAAVLAAGPALRRRYPGVLDIDFALRYEPADMTIRAHQLRVVSLQMTGLPPQAGALLDAYVPALSRQTWSEVVLHTLSAQDLVLPDTMGLRPDRITVQDDGLVVSFTAKAAR